jgi:hypothetical protein
MAFNWKSIFNIFTLFGKLRVAKSDRLDEAEKDLANDAIDAISAELSKDEKKKDSKKKK